MRVFLSWGMGVDSTAILHRWLTDPGSRDFDLSDLVVLTAQTGDEFRDTKALCEKHLLPMLRKVGVRFVQVARADKSESMVVLSDTGSPYSIFIEGRYRESDELMSAGTVPQVAKGRRLCSIHAKGWPLDAWIDHEVRGEQFRHVIGFNAEETKRVKRDKSYSTKERRSEYPLVEWGWGRKACEDYLEDVFKEPWQKSCCVYCPFAAGKEPVRLRYRQDPEAGAFALFLEHVSLCLNPRMTLYSQKSLFGVLVHDRNQPALDKFNRLLDDSKFCVYQVRRIYTAKAHADRAVVPIAHGSRVEMSRKIQRYGEPREDEYGILRVVTIPREEEVYPTIEEMYVVGPDQVPEKMRASFPGKWAKAVRGRVPVAVNPPPGVPEIDLDHEECPLRLDQIRWEREMGRVLTPL